MRIVVIVSFVLSICSVAFVGYGFFNNKNVKTINFFEVYNAFKMKTDLEKKFNASQVEQSKALDSAQVELDALYKLLKAGDRSITQLEFEKKKGMYLKNLENFEQSTNEVQENYRQSIIERLKQYLGEFSKNNNINVLLGKDDGVILLHYDVNLDVTKEALDFVNKKYDGKF